MLVVFKNEITQNDPIAKIIVSSILICAVRPWSRDINTERPLLFTSRGRQTNTDESISNFSIGTVRCHADSAHWYTLHYMINNTVSITDRVRGSVYFVHTLFLNIMMEKREHLHFYVYKPRLVF